MTENNDSLDISLESSSIRNDAIDTIVVVSAPALTNLKKWRMSDVQNSGELLKRGILICKLKITYVSGLSTHDVICSIQFNGLTK
jgi:hypothetical protein